MVVVAVVCLELRRSGGDASTPSPLSPSTPVFVPVCGSAVMDTAFGVVQGSVVPSNVFIIVRASIYTSVGWPVECVLRKAIPVTLRALTATSPWATVYHFAMVSSCRKLPWARGRKP